MIPRSPAEMEALIHMLEREGRRDAAEKVRETYDFSMLTTFAEDVVALHNPGDPECPFRHIAPLAVEMLYALRSKRAREVVTAELRAPEAKA